MSRGEAAWSTAKTEPAGAHPPAASYCVSDLHRAHVVSPLSCFFLMVGLSCVSGAVPCRPVPSRAVRCRFVYTHSHVHADVHWDVQVPTGDQPSREGAAGPQMSAAHDQRAPESAPEKTDFGCNQPRFTKILPAAQGGRLSQAAGRWISTGLTSAPCKRALEKGVSGARKGSGFRVCWAS